MTKLVLFSSLAVSVFLLTACPQTDTPPVDPTVFPVSEISGTLPNWTAGEAYVTAASGY